MAEVRNAIIGARVLIKQAELDALQPAPGEDQADARARYIRMKMREVGIPVSSQFTGAKLEVSTGYLIQRTDHMTGTISLAWKAE